MPTAPVTVAVALADKIDQLAAFFAVGEIPTGSGDPYALSPPPALGHDPHHSRKQACGSSLFKLFHEAEGRTPGAGSDA